MEPALEDTKESTPPSRRRVLILVLAPVAIVLAMTAGMRLLSETSQRREAAEAEATRKQFMSSMAPGGKKHVNPEARIVAPPKPADAATQGKIEQSVRGQIEKITAGDFAGALEFSESHFRSSMSPDRFGAMLKQGFPAMLSMENVSFESASVQRNKTNDTGQAVVMTEIQTKSGDRVRYRYMLVGRDSQWYVYAVLPASPPMGAGRQMSPEHNNPSFNDL